MAVSKTQNERPAINALIDLANGLETTTQGHTVQISNLQGALSSEISSRTSADTLLGNRILAEETARTNADNALESAIGAEATARADAVSKITALIGDNFNELYTVSDFESNANVAIDNLQIFMSQLNSVMRFGVGGAPATVEGNNYYDGTVTYGNSFPDNSLSFAFPAFLSGIDQSDLEVSVSECTNEGFDYTVINRSSTDATFMIGYFAIGFSIN